MQPLKRTIKLYLTWSDRQDIFKMKKKKKSQNMLPFMFKKQKGVPSVVQWINDLACLCGDTDLIPQSSTVS